MSQSTLQGQDTDEDYDEESELVTDRGRTTIADSVVSTIAGISVRAVEGVFSVGGGGQRAVSKLKDIVPGTSSSPGSGIGVEVGETEAAVDLRLVVHYGYPIVALAEEVRTTVIASVEELTGLAVTEVNITVTDVHLAPDAAEGDESA